MDPFHPEGVYPVLQVMLQYAPPAKVPVQLPVPPLATEKSLGMEQDITEDALVVEHTRAVV